MTSDFRIWVCAALVAWQAAAPPPIQERLARVKADLYSRTDRLDENVKELKQILALDPRSADAHMLLGIAYSTWGSKELKGEAIGEFRQALDLDPRLVQVRFFLARLYLDLGRAVRAREELDAGLVQTPGNPEFLALLGETERQLKNPRRAVEVTRQALQADPTFAPARYYLGLALLDAGQRDEGVKELEQVMKAGASVPDAYLSLGSAYIEAGRTAEAIDTLTQGLRLHPAKSELHIALARAYRAKGMLEKADAQLTLGRPAFAKATAGKPSARSASSADYPYQQVELDFHLERGMVKLQRGQLAAAAEAFKKVLELEPAHEAATRELAEVNRRLRAKKPGGGH
jgi:tetratricopeptide (TPR) repeat protein